MENFSGVFSENGQTNPKNIIENYVDVVNITKKYDKTLAVENVSFSIKKEEMVTLIGPSGCGKSTILRCIAGLEKVNDGKIVIEGECVSSAKDNIFLPVEKRDIGMVFQSYAVWPHMTVWGNVAYPLQAHKVKRQEINMRVQNMLSIVGLEGESMRNVTKLSGGQQQRVVLARAMVQNPRLLLFDEPLSNLDARLRGSMRFEIRKLQQRVGISALYVTHDQTEAMVLSDRVIVMKDGHIEQVGTPLDIYRKPASAFVASFFGEVNFIEGQINSITEASVNASIKIGMQKNGQEIVARPQKDMIAGENVYVCIRPQDIELFEPDDENIKHPNFIGKISQIVNMGSHVEYFVEVGKNEIICYCTHELGKNIGDSVMVVLKPEFCTCVRR